MLRRRILRPGVSPLLELLLRDDRGTMARVLPGPSSWRHAVGRLRQSPPLLLRPGEAGPWHPRAEVPGPVLGRHLGQRRRAGAPARARRAAVLRSFIGG